MPRLLAALVVSTTLVVTTHADNASVPAAPAGAPVDGTNAVKVALPQSHRIAVAVNPPLRWAGEQQAFAASFYVALGGHHVVRGNFARYAYGHPLATETTYDGNTNDLGASYMYFPRRAFDGFNLEAGYLRRTEDGVGHGPFEDDDTEKTTLHAARAMIGWSWMFAERGFFSVQVGASFGKNTGTMERCYSSCMDEDPDVTRISETTTTLETSFRFGVAL
ncbi:MAG: hypothetical protein ACKV2T_02370 [Kofleriaceae bacterium]